MALVVRIKGDASHFEKTMAKVKATASGLGSALGAVGKAAAYTAAGLTAIAAVGAGVGLHLAKMAEEGQAAEDRLANIVKQMDLFGSGASKVSDRLGALADKTALLVGVDDDLILATQAKLATFKELAISADRVGGAFDRATMAAVDMAAAGFGEATQNAVQLGKALNDPIKGINSLTRSGITFTTQEKDKIRTLVESNKMLEAQDMVLKAIEKQVGGTAEATAKGSQRIGVALSQIGEKIGAPISGLLDKMADGLVAQMPTISAAISNAIAGDYEIFVKTGVVLGEALKQGILASVMTVGDSVNRFAKEVWISGTHGRKWGDEKTQEALGPKASASDFLSGSTQTGSLADALEGFRQAVERLKPAEGPRDGTLEQIRDILKKANQAPPVKFSR